MLIMLAVAALAIPTLATRPGQPDAPHAEELSIICAVVLLIVFAASIPFSLSGGPGASSEGVSTEKHWPMPLTIIILAGAGVAAAFVSDWFVAALKPTIEAAHISEGFAGLVIVAIAGNAVENFAGIMLAAKGQADLAISVVKNSVAQVAAFLYPALVLISLLFAHQLTFALAPVYIGALLVTSLAVWQITGDGEALAFEGWALIATYVILAALTLYE